MLHKLHGLRELRDDAAHVVHVEMVELGPFEPLPDHRELRLRAMVAAHLERHPNGAHLVLHLPDCGGDAPRRGRRPFGVRRCALAGIRQLTAGATDGLRRASARLHSALASAARPCVSFPRLTCELDNAAERVCYFFITTSRGTQGTRKFGAWGSTPRPGSRAASVTLGYHHKPFGPARTARGIRALELASVPSIDAQRGGLSAAGRTN